MPITFTAVNAMIEEIVKLQTENSRLNRENKDLVRQLWEDRKKENNI